MYAANHSVLHRKTFDNGLKESEIKFVCFESFNI